MFHLYLIKRTLLSGKQLVLLFSGRIDGLLSCRATLDGRQPILSMIESLHGTVKCNKKQVKISIVEVPWSARRLVAMTKTTATITAPAPTRKVFLELRHRNNVVSKLVRKFCPWDFVNCVETFQLTAWFLHRLLKAICWLVLRQMQQFPYQFRSVKDTTEVLCVLNLSFS